MYLKTFFLNSGINFYFNRFLNCFFLSDGLINFYFFLPSFYFFFSKFDSFSFFFSNKFFFKSFISHFKTLYVSFCFYFFSKYKLRGLGYRVKHITKNLIRFFIGTTNFYYVHIPFSIFVKAKRRRLFLISYSRSELKEVFLHLGFLKKIIPYKLRGFFFPRQFVLMKPGKKRF